MKKQLYIAALFLGSLTTFAQEKNHNISGGLESNFQWYTNDKNAGDFDDNFSPGEAGIDDHVRSNNYLNLRYNYGKFTAGIQGEFYLPRPLLNYSPYLDDSGVSTFFVNYKTDKLDITGGNFYDQFGSGIIFRSWENRQLGINNSVRGARVNYKPMDALEFTAFYGRQKEAFGVSDGDMFGFNSEISLTDLLNKDSESSLNLGLSYVGRSESTDSFDMDLNPDLDDITHAVSARLDYNKSNFYGSFEYAFKSKDIVVMNQNFINGLIKDGNAFLLNMGYSQKGFGVDWTLRRMENMSFYSERSAPTNVNLADFNMDIVNYIPALTKQQDYLLTNIYVYQAQPGVSIITEERSKAGEIGHQLDLFYKFKKGSSLGGKYGTKIAFNVASWYNLSGDYSIQSEGEDILDPSDDTVFDYDTDFFDLGDRYFTEVSFEVRKKFSKKLSTIFTYVDTFYSKEFVEDTSGEVNADVVVGEATYKLGKGKSIRMELQHLWANKDLKNWAAGTLEYNISPRFTVYVSDMYNYGNDDEARQLHYYNAGVNYTKGATRIGTNFGRQRGGLICVGGVCRFVPESNGLTVNITTSF